MRAGRTRRRASRAPTASSSTPTPTAAGAAELAIAKISTGARVPIRDGRARLAGLRRAWSSVRTHVQSGGGGRRGGQLAGRPADTVAALVDAAVEEITETGFDGLTVRNVARRAGVSPATAYTYFASKEHLLTEVFWRRLVGTRRARRRQAPERPPIGSPMRSGDIALLVADEPELAAGVTTAMLAHDPDVKVLRDRSARLSAAGSARRSARTPIRGCCER